MKGLRFWWLWLLVWVMVSAVAVAQDFSQSLSEGVFSKLQARVNYLARDDFRLSFVHPEQLAQVERLLTTAGNHWQLDVDERASLLGQVAVPINIFHNGNFVRRWVLACKTEVSVPVLRLLRNVDKGEVLTAADVQVQRLSVASVPAQALHRADLVQGLQSKMALGKGSVLMPWMLGTKALVQENDPVQIVLQGKAFLLKVAGVALQDGGRDEQIRVKNADSQKILLARVVDVGEVVVTSE